ncbi:hypothetical protein [Sphingomonas sp. DC1100-1]|uniref:hypothetical protein n=1 Tax=unclassified Sphingomonas TaxID=196159 RepID=UPI003CE83943
MTAALCFYAVGITALALCHGWWRNPSDYLTRALSAGRTVWTSLYAKGPQA